MTDCTMCGGSGEVHEAGYSASPFSGVRVPDPQETVDRPCPRCHGTGVEEQCVHCGIALNETGGLVFCQPPHASRPHEFRRPEA